jgi:glycine/D-amino acid oxidase-like deaminating enzyme
MPRVIVPDVDDNDSMWWHTARPAEPFPALNGDCVADVVVIGAGFTGMSSAWHIQRRFPDRRVVVLEARRVASGASGRNGGQMLNWINGVGTEDEATTKRVFGVTRGGIDDIVGLIEREGLPVRYRRDGCVEVQTEAGRAEEAEQKVARLNGWGIPVRYLRGAELGERLAMQGAVGAIYDPTAGLLHGVDFLRALAARATAFGVAIHELSPVVRIEEGARVRVTTPGGTVTAHALVLGTSAHTPGLGYFKTGVFALHSHVVASESGAVSASVAGFSDDYDRIAYAGYTPDGHVVFGGGSNASYAYLYGNRGAWSGSRDSAFAAVERRMGECFGEAAPKPRYRWSGALAVTMSRLPSIGVMGEHRNVYYGIGYSGHGVTLGNIAGQVISDLYADHHEPWRDLPFYNRSLGGIPPEPFRWVGYHVYTGLTGRSPRHQD